MNPKIGIDRTRSRTYKRPFYAVDPVAVWIEGMIATLDEDAGGHPIVRVCTSNDLPLGTFWKSKSAKLIDTNVNEPIKFTANAMNLLKAYIVANSVKVTNVGGTVIYIEGVDYSINYINGIITRITIPLNATVWVTYRYEVPPSEVQFYGVGYDRIPDQTLGTGMVVVIEDWAQIFTKMFDTQAVYRLNDALRVNDLGLLTTALTYSRVCAKVISVPSASDPWLGYEQRAILPSET